MKKTLTILIFLVVHGIQIQAQKHDNWWITIAPGLDNDPTHAPFPSSYLCFDFSPPHETFWQNPFPGNAMYLTMSDQKGNVIFYSNAYNIYHMNGEVIENGSGITEDTFPAWYPFSPPMPMAMMGLPRPNHEDDYYILHLEGGPGFFDRRRLILMLITDATGPQAGSVAFKNKALIDNGHWLEFFQATRHANGRDWWVVVSDADSVTQLRTFYSFFLGADTAYLAQTQQFDGYEPVPPAWNNGTFQRVFTPDGKYLITLDLNNGIRVHPFDRCTGELAPFFNLPFQYNIQSTLGGGIAVSPNSRFLYVNNAFAVWQYDLWADDIAASIDTVAKYDGFFDHFFNSPTPTYFTRPSLGPDGKIYYVNAIPSIHYIAKPNQKGSICDVRQHALQLSTYFFAPPYYPNYRLGPLDGSSCDTLGLNNEPLADFWWFGDSTLSVEFADNSFYEPNEWHWDFGDGSTSQDTSPVHLFPAPGVYTVCLTVSNPYAADTVCKQVTVTASTGSPTLEQPEPLRLTITPNPADANIVVRWPAGDLPASARLELLDVLGVPRRSVALDRQSAFAEVFVGDLPAGMYFCRLMQSSKIINLACFTIQH